VTNLIHGEKMHYFMKDFEKKLLNFMENLSRRGFEKFTEIS